MLSNYELIIRLLLAAFLGSLIGFERERMSWAAGLRTHMLVCVGACLVMIVSAFGFADTFGNNRVILDPSRVAAQVVSGIGFLGAGAILLRGEVVRGLTTAASVWAVAGVGLAVGGGLYVAAGAATAIILVILAGIKPLEDKYKERRQSCVLKLQAIHGEFSPELLHQIMRERYSHVKQLFIQSDSTNGSDNITVRLSRIPPKEVTDIVERLRKLPGISNVKEDKI